MPRFAIAILFAAVCQSSVAQQVFPFKDLVFQGLSGYRPGESFEYFLFKTHVVPGVREDEVSTVISEWSTLHPNAQAVPVSVLGERSRLPIVYLWAVDGDDNLNLLLVRKGIYPALSMLDARGGTRMIEAAPAARYIRKVERQNRIGNPGNLSARKLISQARYETFVEQLVAAEMRAQAEAQGIWSDRYKELRDRIGLVPLGTLPISILQMSSE